MEIAFGIFLGPAVCHCQGRRIAGRGPREYLYTRIIHRWSLPDRSTLSGLLCVDQTGPSGRWTNQVVRTSQLSSSGCFRMVRRHVTGGQGRASRDLSRFHFSIRESTTSSLSFDVMNGPRARRTAIRGLVRNFLKTETFRGLIVRPRSIYCRWSRST